MNNLINLPTINCITLERLSERHILFADQCKKYNLNYNFAYGYEDLKDSSGEKVNVTGPWLNSMNIRETSVTLSHIKAIKDWFFNSDDEYGFFCEDDLCLDINEYWPFNWDYVIENLPNEWLAVQLSLIRDMKNKDLEDHIKLAPYLWDNWSACAYLISRKYAKIIIDSHVKDDNSYDLNLVFYPDATPYIENALYNASRKENIYTLPIFIENVDVTSSFYPDFIKMKQKDNQKDSSDIVRSWWERNGNKLDLNWFFNKSIQDS
jgi:GR25 family glycosyltransferase involved in LPS biosynthesis